MDVEASLEALGNGRETIAASWEAEKTVETEEQLKQLLRDQMPFHFHGEPPPGYAEETVGSPEVLRYFANIGYGAFDYRPKLSSVRKPTLIVVGEHDRTTTPRAARVLHEGIPNSELVVIPDAGHMSFVEKSEPYLTAVRRFLSGVAIQA
jgi:proline iminopeptidase